MPSAPIQKAPSRVAKANAAIQRLRLQIDKGREAGTMVVKNLVSQGEASAVGGIAGFCDQKFGTDDGTGIRQHTTSGVPTVALVAAGLDVAAGFGMFGDYQRDAFAMATGALAAFASTVGRRLAVNLERRLEKRASEREKAPAQVTEGSATAAAVVNGAATPAAVAVSAGT